jgi:hypothetical protein
MPEYCKAQKRCYESNPESNNSIGPTPRFRETVIHLDCSIRVQTCKGVSLRHLESILVQVGGLIVEFGLCLFPISQSLP